MRYRLWLLVVTFALIAAACSSDGSATTSDGAAASSDDGPTVPVPTTSSTTTVAPTTSSAPDEQGSDGTTSSTEAATTTTTTTTTTLPPDPTTPLQQVPLRLERIAEANSPVALVPHPVTGDLFVAEQGGRLRRIPAGTGDFAAELELDLRGRVSGGNEQGLLGLAFSPGGERLYVNMTDRAGDSHVLRYESPGGDVDPDSEQIVLSVDQPRGNHNGGHLTFGPDGYLHVGFGDGGGGGDPFRTGQDPNSLLGAMLRIDVEGVDAGRIPDTYDIPPDNPYVGGGGLPEVYAIGVRNPWRYDFDPLLGDLWIADVGQDRFEEVTVLRAADGLGNGANLGWNQTEGSEAYRQGTIPADHTPPITEYAHARDRCSITGGEVYRGNGIPELVGTYLFGDFCTGELFGIRVSGEGGLVELDVDRVRQVAAFGEDVTGEVYVLSKRGTIDRLVAG